MSRATRFVVGCAFAALLAAGATGTVRAQGAAAEAACPSIGDARARLDCLGAALKTSEAELAHAVAATRAAIEAQTGLADTQRRRWSGLMEEAQGRFTHWRDFECQSIAPYESGDETAIGGRRMGIGSLSERMLCLIRANNGRTADLIRRYPAPPGWTYVEPAPPVPSPLPAAGPPRIIAP